MSAECWALSAECWVLSAECWLLQTTAVRGYQLIFLPKVVWQKKKAKNVQLQGLTILWVIKTESWVLSFECWVLSYECWVMSAECWFLQAITVRGYTLLLPQVVCQKRKPQMDGWFLSVLLIRVCLYIKNKWLMPTLTLMWGHILSTKK